MTSNNKLDQFISLTKRYFKLYLGIAITIFLFILFFQPFDVLHFEFENKLLFIAGFGIIVLFILTVVQIVFQHRLVLSGEENMGDSVHMSLYFVTQVILTSLGFIFYIRYVGQNNITYLIVAKVIFICLSLPITIYIKNRINSDHIRIRQLLNESREINNKLKQFSENYANKYIELLSENDSDNFRIQVSEIVYVKSADNYVEIGYHDEGSIKKKMIRNTLRNIEIQIKEYNNFIRTHRTCIVNIQYIDKLNKNFNTYWLSLENSKESIPVSRQYLVSVKDLI